MSTFHAADVHVVLYLLYIFFLVMHWFGMSWSDIIVIII